MSIYAISKCLVGEPCRYDGAASTNTKVMEFLADKVEGRDYVLVCPEQLGGLPTPRVPAEIVGGSGDDVLAGRARVVNAEGGDVTDSFLEGAEAAAEMSRQLGATDAILKAKSPSCGVHRIYDGTFTGRKRAGNGVAAARLAGIGVRVITDEDL